MLKFILKRIVMAIVTLWVVITITFVLMHAIPGDPFTREDKMPAAVFANMQAYYNLDKPLPQQYLIYLNNIIHLDFGPSMTSNVITVNDYIVNGFPVSASLAIRALLIAVFFGMFFGVTAALNHNKWLDYLSMVIAIIGISVPSFMMATLLMNFVSVKWGILPVARWGTWKHTVLPSVSLAMMPMATFARLMRSSMLEVLGQDYIKTAKSKGISRSFVILKHTIKNSLLPVVTVLGTIITNLVTGSFIIEKIFAIPGLGDMLIKSISNRDYTAIIGSTVFYSFILIVMTLLIDIAYTFIDPRIRITGGTKE